MSTSYSFAKVTFFKESGKYYMTEIYDFSLNYCPEVVFDQIKDKFANTCKGMHMVVTFDDNYNDGYPWMQPADQRR